MGLCGPLRADQAKESKYCGLFKTPTLRNVATRRVFFHNGRFHTLREALRFYVRRDTDPQLWYPVSPSGAVNKFDDLPQSLRSNIDVIDEPDPQQRSISRLVRCRDRRRIAFLEPSPTATQNLQLKNLPPTRNKNPAAQFS